jgi:hypothetical protein
MRGGAEPPCSASGGVADQLLLPPLRPAACFCARLPPLPGPLLFLQGPWKLIAARAAP